MKFTTITLFFLLSVFKIQAQSKNQNKTIDDQEYIEFNDRNNIVHGVYMGLSTHYTELNKEPAIAVGFKLAYVANQKFEIGLEVKGYQSQSPFIVSETVDNKLGGGQVGLHLEPIVFSKRKVSLSFPLFVGVGALTYLESSPIDFDEDFIDTEFENFRTMFVIEPGISALFNVSRYFQLEAGIKYRLTNNFDLATSQVENFNGFSAGIGFKIGVFNMGRNRYKKNL
jgi:hypothetical protein